MFEFTSEDLMIQMDLGHKDNIRVGKTIYVVDATDFTLVDPKTLDTKPITWLVDKKYDKVPRKIRVGELEAYDKDHYYNYKLVPLLDYKCNLCETAHLKIIDNVLEEWYKQSAYKGRDDEIYEILKRRCDEIIEVI